MILEEITFAFRHKNLSAGSGGRLMSAAAVTASLCSPETVLSPLTDAL